MNLFFELEAYCQSVASTYRHNILVRRLLRLPLYQLYKVCCLQGLEILNDLPIHDAEPPIMMPTLVYKAMRAQVHQRINGPTHHTEAQTMEPIMGELK